MKKGIGKDYYDHTHDHSSSPGTTWDHIIKASRMKTFADFDRDGARSLLQRLRLVRMFFKMTYQIDSPTATGLSLKLHCLGFILDNVQNLTLPCAYAQS